GLTTANIRTSLVPNRGFYGAFLNAAGRVLHDVFIYPASGQSLKAKVEDKEPRFLIEVDAREVERLAAHLRRFKLRAKITVRVLEEAESGVWGLWGQQPLARPWPGKQIGCEDTRAPGMGRRLVLPGGTKPEPEDEKGTAWWGQETSVESYEVRRMLKGVAEGQGEILRETALPLESNMDYMGGIDFHKGCYVGQELTIRTRHTGVVRKRILPVQLYPADPSLGQPMFLSYNPPPSTTSSDIAALPMPPPGTRISRVDPQAPAREAGKWLGGVGNIGLALCRLESMTDTVITDADIFRSKHEFWAKWHTLENRPESADPLMPGTVVKIKAFVPIWHEDPRKIVREGNPLIRKHE
ncbi:ccr4 associated factor, partial [Sticta canariensis]|nr:ccr4 associated factor [Sticta canariensis]